MQRLIPALALVAVALAAFFLGRSIGPPSGADPHPHEPHPAATWTCPMHPQVQLPDDVPCPICGMDLVPMDATGGPGPGRLALTEEAAALAGVRTAEVRRGLAQRPVRLVGLLRRDETTLRTVSANVPGRIERLFVDRVGVEVGAGEHLFEIYSPALFSAQTEFVQVVKRINERGGNTGAFLDESLQRNYESARSKLVLYGLDDEQIDAVGRSLDPNQRIEVRSPVDGTVVERHVEQGDYVQVGAAIYELAGLEDLWLELEAHEQDLAWLAWGQEVVATFEALPGEVVRGKVSFVDPELDPDTRTVSLRVHVHDRTGRLKPGMFARATVSAELDARGQVVRPDYSGLWVSPMHPEVVSDGPGQCTVCGMDLVPASELGLGPVDFAGEPLLVPETAVLLTGQRAVAYVQVQGTEEPTFELRQLTLGPRADDQFVVLDGLKAGEQVVVEGAFRIDSAMQIRGQRSMLSMPADPGPGAGPDGAAFRASLAPAVERYLELRAALAGDAEADAQRHLAALRDALPGLQPALLPRRAEGVGRARVADFSEAVQATAGVDSIAGIREAFEPISMALLALVERFGAPGEVPLYRMHCPMAFDDRGASWLQRDPELRNPYFGASMLRCGETQRTFGGADPAPPAPAQPAPSAHDASHSMPSAPDPDPDPVATDHASLWDAYLEAAILLAADDALGASVAIDRVPDLARAVETEDDAERTLLEGLALAAEGRRPSLDIEVLRADFERLSDAARALLEVAGNRSGGTLRVAYCPMAFDNRGSRWVQQEAELANPYFGASMLRCGEFEQVLSAR